MAGGRSLWRGTWALSPRHGCRISVAVRDILNIVAELKQTGVVILLVEQNAKAALQIADYGYVMELGEMIMHGPVDRQLAAHDPRVIKRYLGVGSHRYVAAQRIVVVGELK